MFNILLPYEFRSDLLAVVHVILATTVSVHVLLKKRNVRATIAWIGLAWLSPLFGALLYYVLGVNRVSRRAARLSREVVRKRDVDGTPAPELHRPEGSIAIVAALGERLTGRALTSGNAVSILRNGDEAYPAMLAAINGAERSIALASYIFRNDKVGLGFVDALIDAQARGVDIRVLVDGVGGGYFYSAVARRLRKAGIFTARFLHHWTPWRMPFLNLRNHKKILVVDGAVGFVGGLNIGAENLVAENPPSPVSDVHFRIEGPVVSQLMLTFAEDWNFTTDELLEGEIWWPELSPSGEVSARGISSGPDQDLDKLEAMLAIAVGAARQRLRICTPYFLPDEHLMSTIAAVALAGVQVEIVLPQRSDLAVLDWATCAHLSHFKDSGVHLYFEPPPFDHAKLMTVDDRWSLVGSANWDIRSTRLNFEFSLECYGETMAAEIGSMIDAKIARARRISPATLAARPLPLRLRDAGARLMLPYL